MSRIRFVGGPMHGETKDIQREARYMDIAHYEALHAWTPPEKYAPPYRRFTYERRRLALTPLTFVEVMVPPQMGQEEAARALANIIDGV